MEKKFKIRKLRYNHLILLYVILATYVVFYVYDTSSIDSLVVNYIILGVVLLGVVVLVYFILRKFRFFDRVGISEQGITLHVPFKDREFYGWDKVVDVEKYQKSHKTRSTQYIKITINSSDNDHRQLFIEHRQEIYDEIEKYYNATKSL